MYKKPVSCLAVSRVQADRAVNHLINGGFSRDEISVLFPCGRDAATQRKAQTAALSAPNWEIGGAIGWLPDLGSFWLPGAGRFVVAGPLCAALGGPTATLTIRVVADALHQLGVPTVEAWAYVESVEAGQVLISFGAETADEAEAARKIFQAIGATSVTPSEPASLIPLGMISGINPEWEQLPDHACAVHA